jgi:hypothetical protein
MSLMTSALGSWLSNAILACSRKWKSVSPSNDWSQSLRWNPSCPPLLATKAIRLDESLIACPSAPVAWVSLSSVSLVKVMRPHPAKNAYSISEMEKTGPLKKAVQFFPLLLWL